MSKIQVYILEDELITREVLKESLEKLGYEICGMQDNAMDALAEINTLKPDFAILDIRVKGEHDGIWLGNQLTIPFIYLTAFSDIDTVKKAIETKPSSYLIKPFKEIDIYTTIELAIDKYYKQKEGVDLGDNIHYSYNGELLIKDGYTYFKMMIDDIYYLKTDGKYLELHLADKSKTLRVSLTNFLTLFKELKFIQVHKSFAVNLNKIVSFDAKNVQLKIASIPISRGFKNSFIETMRNR